MKLYEQYPGIYTRGKLKDSHLDEVKAGGYAVIALTPRPNFLLQTTIPEYHHFPLPDGKVTEKVLNQLQYAVSEVLRLVTQGTPVIIHCNAGRNRASLVAALTIRELSGLSGDALVAMIRTVRPRALANPYFEAFLRGLE